jgi:hypothetical protein
MMGRDMQYGGLLVLSVAGVNDKATGMKATAALGKLEGVARVTLYPQQEAVGVEFSDKGKVTSKQLYCRSSGFSSEYRVRGEEPSTLRRNNDGAEHGRVLP